MTATLPFAKLNELLALKLEHQRWIRAAARLTAADLDDNLSHSAAEITLYGRNRSDSITIKADPQDGFNFMRSTVERALSSIERRMAELGVSDIHRDHDPDRWLPELDDEIPF